MRVFLAPILVCLLAGAACSEALPNSSPVEERAVSICMRSDGRAASYIERQLVRLKETSSIEEGEQLGIELGAAFESHPCEFIEQAIDAGLGDRQIAGLIAMTSVEFVDKPCESEDLLLARLRSLKSVPDVERTASIEASVRESLGRDAAECLKQVPGAQEKNGNQESKGSVAN